jgi:hypothetical protein
LEVRGRKVFGKLKERLNNGQEKRKESREERKE